MNGLNFTDFVEGLELPADDLRAQIDSDNREWHRRRLGRITASMVGKLMTSSRTKGEVFGQTAMTEIYRLSAERMLTDEGVEQYIDEQVRKDFIQTRWGKDNEPMARQRYQEVSGLVVTCAGGRAHPELPYFTGSPDGLIAGGIIEIKCPWNIAGMYDAKYIDNHMVQMQALMAIFEVGICEFIKYDPRQRVDIKYDMVVRDDVQIGLILDRVRLAEALICELVGEGAV